MAKRTKIFTRKTMLLAALAVVALVLIIFVLTRNHKSVSGTIPSTSTSSSTDTNSDKTSKNAIPSTDSTSNGTSSDKASDSTSSTLPLTAPWGNFVSNHLPGKDGAPTSETSTCNTTPGASCYIQFTMGGITKNLVTKTADNNGSASWSWDIKDADLSPGKWQITAVATLNGQTKSTPDQLSLEVQ